MGCLILSRDRREEAKQKEQKEYLYMYVERSLAGLAKAKFNS